jgi:LacI family transcriptional regulator
VTDVAAAAGVSPTTVSHALSGARTVNPATRERILSIARELGYVPDRVASGLRRRRTGVVALIGDDLAATPFAGRIIEGARRAGLEHDVLLMVGESGGDAAAEADLVARFLAQRVDGLLIARMYHQQVDRPAVPEGFPVVLVDAAPEPGWEVDAVVPNEAQIAALACDRLLSAGHRNIAYIGTTESRAARGRLAGVRSVLGDAGIALGDGRLAFCYADAAGGRQAGGELLDQERPPTAIICFNDQIAMGVMQAAARRGITLPDGLSVMGIDDLHPVADALDPGLTTVALPHAEMGRWGMARLIERIEGTPIRVDLGVEQLPGWLVERGSIAAPSR